MIDKIFLLGLIILAGAIVINVLASVVGVQTWYDLLTRQPIKWYSYIFLFVVYPLLLGVLGYYGHQLLF